MPSPIDATHRHVFVYGTLRRDEQRDINKLKPKPRYVAEGRLHGVLYDLGSYPGLAIATAEMLESTPVQGEIYAITPELERILDEIEEVWPQQTGEYAKREVWVDIGKSIAAPDALLCLVYEIAPSQTQCRPVIAGGDWVAHRKANTRD